MNFALKMMDCAFKTPAGWLRTPGPRGSPARTPASQSILNAKFMVFWKCKIHLHERQLLVQQLEEPRALQPDRVHHDRYHHDGHPDQYWQNGKVQFEVEGLAKLIIFNEKFIIFNAQFLGLNNKFLVFNAKFLVFNAKIFIFTWPFSEVKTRSKYAASSMKPSISANVHHF